MSNLTNNTSSLQELLNAVNALPEAGGDTGSSGGSSDNLPMAEELEF